MHIGLQVLFCGVACMCSGSSDHPALQSYLPLSLPADNHSADEFLFQIMKQREQDVSVIQQGGGEEGAALERLYTVRHNTSPVLRQAMGGAAEVRGAC